MRPLVRALVGLAVLGVPLRAWAAPPRDSDSQPRESAAEPRESAAEPRESATQPRESATQPRESATQPRESATQPRESVADVARATPREVAGREAARKVSPVRTAPAKISAPEKHASGGVRTSGWPAIVTALASLVLVLGLFGLATWLVRKSRPAGLGVLPREVAELLGRIPLAGRQQAHLLRLGNKLVLVALQPGAAETLTEVTDPAEVDRLVALCRTQQPGSAVATFKGILQQFARERVTPGFLGRSTGESDRREAGKEVHV